MAEFTHKDLKRVREGRKMPRWKLGTEIGVSEDTIENWENGKTSPHPDDISNIEKALDLKKYGLWHKWMMSHYDSYRERYTDVPDVDNLTGRVIQMKHEILDIMPLFDGIERDTLNGEFNKPELWGQFRKEALEAVSAIQQTLEIIPDEF